MWCTKRRSCVLERSDVFWEDVMVSLGVGVMFEEGVIVCFGRRRYVLGGGGLS